VVVALRLTADSPAGGRPLISAYNAATGARIASTPMAWAATEVTLAGATNGVAALNLPGPAPAGPAGPHVLDWTWTRRHDGSEWRRGRAFDLANRVVLVDWRVSWSSGPRFENTGWRFVDSRPGERLDPTGEWRVDTTWQPWPSGGPVERSTSGKADVPLPDMPRGSHVSLSYDTDGSVLAAVASDGGGEAVVRVFDCESLAQACEAIGRVESAPAPLFLDGTKP
jgi:hypothetical protein